MATTSDNVKGGVSSEINVTPLIDVLLVLLIIFMVIVPITPKGLEALIPKPPMESGTTSPRAVVVSVLHSGGSQVVYQINRDEVGKSELLSRLTTIFQNRSERTLFVKGDEDVNFAQVAEVIDIGHSAGVDHVGILTPKILQGM